MLTEAVSHTSDLLKRPYTTSMFVTRKVDVIRVLQLLFCSVVTMKVFVIILATIVSQVFAHESTAERAVAIQIQKNEIDYQIDDKTTIIRLSSAVNAIASHLLEIVESIGTSFVEDLELLVHPLEDVILFVWSAPLDKALEENLYFLFDKVLDIVYCIYEMVDDTWHGVSYIIESKLSQISTYTLEIVDEMKALSEQSEDNDTDVDKFASIRETTVDLTTSIVGLTSLTTSIAQAITTRDRSLSLILGTIASLILIHQYAVAAVASVLSRAVKAINSLDAIHATGIAGLEATIVDFISNLELILQKKGKANTMTQLFHGGLHTKLSMQLLVSMNGLMATKMTDMIYTTTTWLLTVIEEYAPRAFHVLPDLIGQLTVISLRCGRTHFDNLERFITYAFDGLFDILNHISYKLDRHIQSSASTGSFPEPSEPIDIAVANVRTDVKRFIRDYRHRNKSDMEELTAYLIASTSEMMTALLDPMNIVIRKSEDDYSITLASSLQFTALYVVGLILTPLISATRSLQNFTSTSETFSNFGATLSLVFIKIEIIFDYSKTEKVSEQLERLYTIFDDLFQDLAQLNNGSKLSRRTTNSRTVNAFDQFVLL